MSQTKVFFLTVIALVAFAANSIFCRLALESKAIDPAFFTLIRMFSGAVTLFLFLYIKQNRAFPTKSGSYTAALALFLYAVCFSFAYVELGAAIGALILFASVQMTIFVYSRLRGEAIGFYSYSGLSLAFCGLVYLYFPAVNRPDATGSLAMVCSGVAWGAYTLLGSGSKKPLLDTTWNFIYTVPLCLVTLFWFVELDSLTTTGIIYALLSGVFASAMGYAVWYAVLPFLARTVAGVSQLLVPILAAIAGVIWLSESITLQLLIASALVLSGILAVLWDKKRQND